VNSRGLTSYSAASAAALENPADFTTMGNAFPATSYKLNSVTASVTVPLSPRLSVRLFDYYERGDIDDWHYANFNQSLAYGTSLYTDGGPQGYHSNIVGLWIQAKL